VEVTDIGQIAPSGFTSLGYKSLKNFVDTAFLPREVYLTEISVEDLTNDGEPEISVEATSQEFETVKLRPIPDESTVVGIDTSSIELGETENGVLCAVRGGIVWRENGSYQYVRHGPFIFHVTEMNKYALYNSLRRIYFGASDGVYAPSLWQMLGRIRNVLERWLQRQVCESYEQALLLWDGSLTAGTIDSPVTVLSGLLQSAESRSNVILAFSKKTRLYVSGRRVMNLIDDQHAPCLLSIDDFVRSQYGNRLRFLGRVHAVKLAPSYFSFRLDVDRRIPEEGAIEAVQRLIGNDIIVESYPETLRRAHILCTFSASEVIAMQRYVAENYGLKIVLRPNVRQVLFGHCGGGSFANKTWRETYDAAL
jgi:hypothetical protein